MMRNKWILFLLIGIASKSFSQSTSNNYELGYFLDINYQMIDGYFDNDYEPEKSLDITYTLGEDYTPGYYYDLNNNKTFGLIKNYQINKGFNYKYFPLNNDKNSFESKANKESKKISIDSKQCKSYVVGKDSFIIINHFTVQRKIASYDETEDNFAVVLDKVGDLTFCKHTTSDGYGIITYLVNAKGSSYYQSFPRSKNKFKEVAISIFGEVESLKIGINRGKYTIEDIPTLIKLLKYKRKYDTNEKIYYNSCGDEVDNPDCSTFYALVESVKDTIFRLKYYFNNNTPICEGNFTSFFPNKKCGDFLWYYPTGKVRRIVTYTNNQPGFVKTFFPNGNMHYKYMQIEKNNFYYSVYNLTGEDILDNSGKGNESFYDSIAKRQITREFVNNRLFSSYYTDGSGKKIYQYCEKNAKLKVYYAQTRLQALKYPTNSILNGNHGLLLIRCIVEPTGLVSDIRMLKGIDADCDSALLNSISFLKTNELWRPAKSNNELVTQELVIPIDFSLNSFSVYKYNFNDFWMMRNMMQMQMIRTPSLPIK